MWSMQVPRRLVVSSRTKLTCFAAVGTLEAVFSPKVYAPMVCFYQLHAVCTWVLSSFVIADAAYAAALPASSWWDRFSMSCMFECVVRWHAQGTQCLCFALLAKENEASEAQAQYGVQWLYSSI